MNLGMETEIKEYKKSTSELVNGVISLASMLNKHGEGTVYFGVKNDGTIIGQKDVNENSLRDVSRKISEGIKPQVIPYISLEYLNNKNVIKVYAKGNETPYSAFDKYYIRSFDEDKKMDLVNLKKLIFKDGLPDITTYTESYNQDLSFNILKNYYIINGIEINTNQFENNLNFYTDNAKYNRLAELLSDKNDISILVATFKGNDKTVLLNRTDYGHKCIITAVNNVLNYVESLNQTKVKLGGHQREEENYFDFNCFKEAWLNAIVHNRWVNGTSPSVYIYDDRIEIVSDGGLPASLSKEDYFKGISKPVNKKLLEIFLQLDLIERTGHGVPLIYNKYGEKAFYIGKETIIVTIPINKEPLYDNITYNKSEKSRYDELTNNEKNILNEIDKNPEITIPELMKVVGGGHTSITNARISLKNKGFIERVGSNKNGHWKILK